MYFLFVICDKQYWQIATMLTFAVVNNLAQNLMFGFYYYYMYQSNRVKGLDLSNCADRAVEGANLHRVRLERRLVLEQPSLQHPTLVTSSGRLAFGALPCSSQLPSAQQTAMDTMTRPLTLVEYCVEILKRCELSYFKELNC